MDEIVKVGDEVFVRVDGRRAIVKHIGANRALYQMDDLSVMSRYEFIPVKWDGDKVGNTGIGVCAKNGSEG